MSSHDRTTPRRWIGSIALIGAVFAAAVLLVAWKLNAINATERALANQPEPVELVTVATARGREHRETTVSVGTVLALRSVTLRNELAGTVRDVSLTPGQIVETGTVLVALDVSVEHAELEAQGAETQLAETTLRRLERLRQHQATSQEEVDQARARLDVARAHIERTRAIIAKKTVRAPFRARVGIADVHPGQYLNEGTVLTTLQGVSGAVHVDFTVSQSVATTLAKGVAVDVVTPDADEPLTATVLATDSRVDPATRNATVRARLAGPDLPTPGSSVRVLVPVGPPSTAVAVPISALRKGPEGDHVWVVAADSAGALRAHRRAVRSGPALGDTVLILSGLSTEEQVAASGSFKLREGVRVEAAAGATASATGTR